MSTGTVLRLRLGREAACGGARSRGPQEGQARCTVKRPTGARRPCAGQGLGFEAGFGEGLRLGNC